jgi:RimJ/RimL family protein N-acetyltransferase
MLGRRVTLRPLQFWDVWNRLWYLELWWRLLTEPGSAHRFGQGKRLARRSRSPAGTTIHRFLIYYGDERVGVADIRDDTSNRVCGLVLGLLEPYRGQKIGSVAGRLMLRKSFTELNAHRVESSALSGNVASLEMQDGMIEEARLLQRVRVGTEVYDEVRFRMLKHEWELQLAERQAARSGTKPEP